jgi:hypothetical protein
MKTSPMGIAVLLGMLLIPAESGVRFVRIEHAYAEGSLALAEVQVFSDSLNVARPNDGVIPIATQDSPGFDPAEKAIDGDTNGNHFNGRSVSITAGSNGYAWWEVNLQQDRTVTGVRIFNRTDCCQERLNPSRIILLDVNRNVLWENKITVTQDSYYFDATQAAAPLVWNYLRNSTFNRCTNPLKPDFWGLDVPLKSIQNIGDNYIIDDYIPPPIPGVRVLKINNPIASPWFRLIPYGAYAQLPNGTYTYSAYVKCQIAGARYKITASYLDGETLAGTLSGSGWNRVSLVLNNNGSYNPNPYLYLPDQAVYYVSAPMLERGSGMHDFLPAPEDSQPDPVHRTLSPVTSPVKLFAGFEYNYYTGESADAEVKLRIESAYDEDRTVRILCDNNGAPVGIRDSNIILKPHANRIISLSNRELPLGQNVFVIEAYQGAVKTDAITRVLPKRTPGPFEVRVNNFKKCFRVNNSCFYPIGITLGNTVPESWLAAELHERNINTLYYVPVWDPAGVKYDDAAANACIHSAGMKGFRVIMGLVFAGARPADWRIRLEKFAEFVGAMKGDTNILAWYPLDEPASNSWSVAEIQAVYDSVTHADPHRPCFVNWCDIPLTIGAQPYGSLNATDIYSMDHYPFAFLTSYINTGMANFTTFTRCVGESAHQLGKLSHGWLQIYGYGNAWREPTPEEIRYMAYHNLVYGSAVSYWAYKSSYSGTWDSLGVINRELTTVADRIFQSPDASEMETGSLCNGVFYSVWRKADTLFIISVNSAQAEAAFAINLDRYGVAKGAFSLFENIRGVSIESNGIHEPFAPYQSRVYVVTLDSAGTGTGFTGHNAAKSPMEISPNPFNPVCRISFNVTKSDQTSLSIYNMKGRLIKTLAQCAFTPGIHTIRWDGSDNAGKPAAAGIYTVRLKSGKETRYFNAVLLK